eukprot:3497098-Pleurochrysis_carterae.AAC.5
MYLSSLKHYFSTHNILNQSGAAWTGEVRLGHDLRGQAHFCATFQGTPEWAQADFDRVKSPASVAATPCYGPTRRAANRSTLLESTAFDRS